MKIITVNLERRSYKVLIGFGVIKSLKKYARQFKLGSDAYVITNQKIKHKYGRLISDSLKSCNIKTTFRTVIDSERAKSLKNSFALLSDLAYFGHKRNLFIIALGGGVIGDLAGFVASIYKRGIPYVQIPTTLLADVDSSIGGKTAVDLKMGKNLVGSFYQPSLVLTELSFLRTLGAAQIQTGLAEIIKYAIIKDDHLFRYLEINYPKILSLDKEAIEFIVSRCAQIKARIVEEDEREEKGIRTILNFGHTFGHAIEAAGRYNLYNHGEAVALGMILAAQLSNKLGFIKKAAVSKIKDLIAKVHLPVYIKNLPTKKILCALEYDKKFKGGINRFVLITDFGKTKIVQNLPLDIIKEVLCHRKKRENFPA
ncbi:MAG: 3-dehydroquinate synthase [Candidatus Omnitrophica bacterium]|nr:3-dehydroquinate synthase [Candidatus Omnitrophota bacterium]